LEEYSEVVATNLLFNSSSSEERINFQPETAGGYKRRCSAKYIHASTDSELG
jgi:hypothetical protein